MSVCKSIEILANELEGQLIDISPSELKLIILLKITTQYSNKKRLDLWEDEYLQLLNDIDKKSINFKTINLIFELDEFNLYGGFQKLPTQLFYEKIVRKIDRMGFKVSDNLDVTCW